jgi:hypothetical protein
MWSEDEQKEHRANSILSPLSYFQFLTSDDLQHYLISFGAWISSQVGVNKLAGKYSKIKWILSMN